MYFISITKVENRRSGTDRRQSDIYSTNHSERRVSEDRRGRGDRRSETDRRSGIYRILTDQQKEKLDRIINVRDVTSSDLVIG